MSDAPALCKLDLSGTTAEITMLPAKEGRPVVICSALLAQLEDILARIDSNPDVRAGILTGTGKAFCAGADIREMKQLDAEAARTFAADGQRVMNRIEASSVPWIAALNGHCLGGGCELALACDIRICHEKARLGQPEVNLGVIPGFGGTQRLARIVGRGRAAHWILTGEIIGAEAALAAGLVSEVTAIDGLLDRARELAGQIAAKGPMALRLAKEAIYSGAELDLGEALALEAKLFGECFEPGEGGGPSEAAEGFSAFLEKRAANWPGQGTG